MADDNNGRITMAVLAQKMDMALNMLEEVRQCQREQASDIVALKLKDKELDGELQRTNDRIGRWAGIQGIFTVIGSAVAAVFGVRN
jgi:hypothetical protein